MNLKEAVDLFIDQKYEYFRNWTLDEPFVFDAKLYSDLEYLQKIMYKLIVHFVENYELFKHLMPVSDKVEKILLLSSEKRYQPGTYRTDFVFDDNMQVKLIEITCRFALNGIFQTAIFNHHANVFFNEKESGSLIKDAYPNIFSHLEKLLADKDKVIVITGEDQKNESKIYLDIFEKVGYKTEKIGYKELQNHTHKFSNSLIIPELSFDELTALDIDIIEEMIKHEVLNDLRTIFLVHDKRFFNVLGSNEFKESVLSASEIEFFNRFYIPTYTLHQNSDLWYDVLANKDAWILKHRALGKSQSVYAGIVTENEEWETILHSIEDGDYVVQKWIPQSTFSGSVKGTMVNDFITGTLLYFDNNFYGLGEFRTSSFPVTNKTDHRKAAGVFLLNYN